MLNSCNYLVLDCLFVYLKKKMKTCYHHVIWHLKQLESPVFTKCHGFGPRHRNTCLITSELANQRAPKRIHLLVYFSDHEMQISGQVFCILTICNVQMMLR